MRTRIKPLFIKILLALAVIILILLAIFVAMDTARSRQTATLLDENQKKIVTNYAVNVSQKTDAYLLTKAGLRQLDINLPDLALISLNRATEIQPNYRDAWLALGLAQLKTDDIKTALSSFQTAEKLDPIYAKTYELLKITYERLEDTASAGKAAEKYDFLTKK